MSSNKAAKAEGIIPYSGDKSPKSSAFSFYNGPGNAMQSFGVTQFI